MSPNTGLSKMHIKLDNETHKELIIFIKEMKETYSNKYISNEINHHLLLDTQDINIDTKVRAGYENHTVFVFDILAMPKTIKRNAKVIKALELMQKALN